MDREIAHRNERATLMDDALATLGYRRRDNAFDATGIKQP